MEWLSWEIGKYIRIEEKSLVYSKLSNFIAKNQIQKIAN